MRTSSSASVGWHSTRNGIKQYEHCTHVAPFFLGVSSDKVTPHTPQTQSSSLLLLVFIDLSVGLSSFDVDAEASEAGIAGPSGGVRHFSLESLVFLFGFTVTDGNDSVFSSGKIFDS
jgi:hypothetical protein